MEKLRLKFSEDRAQESYKDFKQRIFQKIQIRGHSKFADSRLWLKGFALLIFAIGSYFYLFCFASNGNQAVACGAISGVLILLFALNVSHDAAHGSFSRNQHVNTILLFIPFAILGVDPIMWRARHLNSHHRFPNIDSCDADIDENPFIRLSPYQAKRVWHRYQHVYAWPLYFVVALHAAWIQDFNYIRRKTLANMHDWQAHTPTWFEFMITKTVHILFVFLLPLILLPYPWVQIIAGIFLIQGIPSLLFILPLIGTHFSIEAAFSELNSGELVIVTSPIKL